MRPNLFWKLGFAFFALLIAGLLPVDFYAEQALRRGYERAGFEQLSSIARIALAHLPQWPAPSNAGSAGSTEGTNLQSWVERVAAGGARV